MKILPRKPRPTSLTYDIRVERWTYTLHTYTIFKHYYVEGMLWHLNTAACKPPYSFWNVGYETKDVRVRIVNFSDKGKCYEIFAKEVSKLRVAAISLIAMLIKEEYKGLSEGEPNDDLKWYEKFQRYFQDKGRTYEQLKEMGEIPDFILEREKQA